MKRKRGGDQAGSGLERLLEWWMRMHGCITHRAGEVPHGQWKDDTGAVRFRTRAHDIFGAFDLICLSKSRRVWVIQATTEQQVRTKRKRIESIAIFLPLDWRISIVAYIKLSDPRPRAPTAKLHAFQVDDYNIRGERWTRAPLIRFDPAAIAAFRKHARQEKMNATTSE